MPVSSPPSADGNRDVATGDLIGWAAALLVPPAIYTAGTHGGFTVQASIFAAILAATVLMWMFSLVDEFIPPLAAVVATLFIGLAPPSVALAGFASPALLLLLGVFALAATISGSGLSTRVMLWLLARLPDRPFFQQFVVLAGGYLLSPITPSGNNRMSLLLPIYRDMFDGLRLPVAGAAATGLFAATYSGAMLFSPMLATSKSANLAAINLLPLQVQQGFLGPFWLVAAAVAAVGLTLWHFAAVTWMFPDPSQRPLPRERIAAERAALGTPRPAEWIAAAAFLFFLVGSATVSWHHVQPAWIAGCVLVGLLVSGVFGKQEFRRQVDWPLLFFLLGVDGITRIMDHLGLGAALAAGTAGLYGFINGRIELFILAALATTLVIRLALPVTAGMLVSVVILLPVAAAQGIHPWLCVFLAAMFSDIFFMPYQSSVYVQVASQGVTSMFDEQRFMAYNMHMNLARVVIAFLSIPWWNWLGLL